MPNFQAGESVMFSRRSFLKALTLAVVLLKPFKRSPFPETPPPKFWLGDRVVTSWFAEDPNEPGYEIEKLSYGTVTGLAWTRSFYFGNPAYESWWYTVNFDDEEGTVISDSFWCEQELKLDSLASKTV